MNAKITGKLTNKDYIFFDLYRRRYSFLLVVLIGIIVAMIVFPFHLYSILEKIIVLGFSSGGYVLFLFLGVLIINTREYRSLNKRFHERVIQLGEEGLLYGNKGKQGTIHWNDIKKVVFLKRIIILYTRKNHPFLIPKHFFSSSTEEKEWIAFIKQHVPN